MVKSLHIFVSAALIGNVFEGNSYCQQEAPERGSLEWRALRAVEAGKDSVTLSQPIVEYAEMQRLDTAVKRTTVVVAKLLASATTHDKFSIATWQKYQLLEKLSDQPVVPQEALPVDVPKSFLPLQPGEFIMAETSGTVTIKGVKITQLPPEGSIPETGTRRLMFVMFRCSGSVALSNYGPSGLFWLDDRDLIHARVTERNPLASDIDELATNNLSVFKSLTPGPRR